MPCIERDSKGELIVNLVKAIHTVSTRLEILKRQGVQTKETEVLEEIAKTLVDCQINCHSVFRGIEHGLKTI